jgi:hypothetical protein
MSAYLDAILARRPVPTHANGWFRSPATPPPAPKNARRRSRAGFWRRAIERPPLSER